MRAQRRLSLCAGGGEGEVAAESAAVVGHVRRVAATGGLLQHPGGDCSTHGGSCSREVRLLTRSQARFLLPRCGLGQWAFFPHHSCSPFACWAVGRCKRPPWPPAAIGGCVTGPASSAPPAPTLPHTYESLADRTGAVRQPLGFGHGPSSGQSLPWNPSLRSPGSERSMVVGNAEASKMREGGGARAPHWQKMQPKGPSRSDFTAAMHPTRCMRPGTAELPREKGGEK